MKLEIAKAIADKLILELAPHCDRLEIAGSIRRKKPEVKDIEIVAIPKPYDWGLFESGIATVVNKWPKIRGELPCKYTARKLPEGINLDLFFATPDNWGNIFAIRTGSAEFSRRVLGVRWVELGFKSEGGLLRRNGSIYKCPEEKDLFRILNLFWVEPEHRY